MGWCRGKISEGLDFKDDSARLVCVIGIPNASIEAPEIKLKRDYLGKSEGDTWYNLQAPKATN
jgi:Rad3-related DNA helicase